MNEIQKTNLRRIAEWLAGDQDIRIRNTWLVVAAFAVAALMVLYSSEIDVNGA